jgi:hypothetical protein
VRRGSQRRRWCGWWGGGLGSCPLLLLFWLGLGLVGKRLIQVIDGWKVIFDGGMRFERSDFLQDECGLEVFCSVLGRRGRWNMS